MQPFEELEFIYQMPLRESVRNAKGYSFKHDCPSGPDRKRRGYILTGNDVNVVYCHNCGLNTSVRSFLEYNYPSIFEEYRTKEKEENFKKAREGKIIQRKQEIRLAPTSSVDVVNNLKLFQFNPKYFVPASTNNDCVAFAKKRMIPDEIFETLLYNNHPKMNWGGMLIFPFRKGEYVYGFQGRSVTDKRFCNFSNNASFKIYNIFNVNLDKPVYIFEAIIDSFPKMNSTAMCGSDLSIQVQRMIKEPVYCFDNDMTGVVKAIKYADTGNKVLVWPTEIDPSKYKDPNDLKVKGGWTDKQIELMIANNVFTGFGATMKLKLRIRGKKLR
jgi:hypothetical protein